MIRVTNKTLTENTAAAQRTWGQAALCAGATALAVGALSLSMTPDAFAQSKSHIVTVREVGPDENHPYQAYQSGGSITASANLPAVTTPIMMRAATMLQAANARQANAPSSARQSYQAAAAALRQALAAGRYAAPHAGATNPAGLALSPNQIADDIRMLRAASQTANSSQSAALQRVATLYATGAKEFFTGQLRDALYSSNGGSMAYRSYGKAASASMPARYGTRRGADQGGIIQSDGSVAPVTLSGGGAHTAIAGGDAAQVPGSDNPGLLTGPPLVGDAVNPFFPPVVVVAAPTAPVTAPVVTATTTPATTTTPAAGPVVP